ncbi:hypothetical protein Tco_0688025 [Tanacetum coccineum]
MEVGFMYTMLGLGATLCVITCSGHIAAETANGAVTMDVFLNSNWEEDFPTDPSGNFNEFKDFIKENFEICKWVGLSVVSVQGFSVFLALILKALGPHQERHYDSDDEYTIEEVPLLRNYVNQPPYVGTGEDIGPFPGNIMWELWYQDNFRSLISGSTPKQAKQGTMFSFGKVI